MRTIFMGFTRRTSPLRRGSLRPLDPGSRAVIRGLNSAPFSAACPAGRHCRAHRRWSVEPPDMPQGGENTPVRLLPLGGGHLMRNAMLPARSGSVAPQAVAPPYCTRPFVARPGQATTFPTSMMTLRPIDRKIDVLHARPSPLQQLLRARKQRKPLRNITVAWNGGRRFVRLNARLKPQALVNGRLGPRDECITSRGLRRVEPAGPGKR